MDVLASVLDELRRGHRSLLAWSIEHAAHGDPLPAAWCACSDPLVMVEIAARVDRERLARALDAAAVDRACYPHARECLERAARDVRWGRPAAAGDMVASALTHYPGRSTHRPSPEAGRRLRERLCVVLRGEFPTVTIEDIGG